MYTVLVFRDFYSKCVSGCEHGINCDLCVCYSLRHSTGGRVWST